MSRYKISVIIPVYNVEQYINKAIESLKNQSIGFDNLEIIFIDDCSTDTSWGIIETFSKQHNNVKIIHMSENSGSPGLPRNEALKVSTSKYIMFLDPDDYYSNEACEYLYNSINKFNSDIVLGYNREIDESGNVILEKSEVYNCLENLNSSQEISLMEALNFRGSFWNNIYRKELIDNYKIKFEVYIPGQDLIFMCNYLLVSRKIVYIDKLICNYRIRKNENKSISNNLNQKFFKGISKCYKLCKILFLKYGYIEGFNKILYSVIDDYISKMIDSDDLTELELISILEEWFWLFEYINEYKINQVSIYGMIINDCILNHQFKQAATTIKNLKGMKMYLEDVLVAKKWLENQVRFKDERISELEKWIDELEKGKKYLEGHIKFKKYRRI